MDLALQVPDLPNAEFFCNEVLSNPFDFLRRLRHERPVAKFAEPAFGRDYFVVTSYALVDAILRDDERFSAKFREIWHEGGDRNAEAAAILAQSWTEVDAVLTADGADHARMRALIAQGFMPNRVKRMADLIDDLVNELIDRFIERGECDFIREFAVPLPMYTVGAILGLPAEHYDKLVGWVFATMRRGGQMGTPEEQVEDARQIVEYKEFIRELVEDRLANPQDDLISDIVNARTDGESALSKAEMLSNALILPPGAESSGATLASALGQLLINPDQLALVLDDLSLVPKVADETLRHDTPLTTIWRIALHDIEVAGIKIPKGAFLMLRVDSANHDEAMFDEPEKFDITRVNLNKHLAFGTGTHFCVGVWLARKQINHSLLTLLTRLKDIRLFAEKSDLSVYPRVQSRAIRELHLRFTPGRRRDAAR